MYCLNLIQQLIIQLGLTNIMFWYLTLHEKNHFVPGSGGLFGSTFVLSNPPQYENNKTKFFGSNYDMQVTNSRYLNEEGNKCNESEELADFNLCYEKYVESNMNCSVTWRKQNGTLLPDCSTDSQKDFLANVTKDIETMGEKKIYQSSGCFPSCSRREFSVTKFMDSDESSSKNKSIAKVTFYYSSTKYKTKEQYLSFTLGDFIANVGGYLGLLLGYSVISLYDEAKQSWRKIQKSCIRM